jgi:CubicO group peptidase (beta-lactamase class C family)
MKQSVAISCCTLYPHQKNLFFSTTKLTLKSSNKRKNPKLIKLFYLILILQKTNTTMISKILYSLLIVILCISCSLDSSQTFPNPLPIETNYFPPTTGTTWETKSIASLGWKENTIQQLLDYLTLTNSKSFVILVNGRIVMETYFNGHSATANWYWASARKTLTSTIAGIAEQEGTLNINNKVSDYLGTAWTSLPLAKENLITNKHLLTMTSGLEDIDNGDAVNPASLNYKADAGTRWAYHNVYVKLQNVIAKASGQTWSSYFNTRLRDKIGMDGYWIQTGNNSVYASTARSMARFGLLMENKGKWDNTIVLNEAYFNATTNTSQNINLGYGYLWWLNGKTNYHLPQSQLSFSGSLIPSAAADMFMALGKNDQKVYIIHSTNMVVVRMGNSADNSNLALSHFDDILWQKITALYQ